MGKKNFYKMSLTTEINVMVANWACAVTEILTQ